MQGIQQANVEIVQERGEADIAASRAATIGGRVEALGRMEGERDIVKMRVVWTRVVKSDAETIEVLHEDMQVENVRWVGILIPFAMH